MSVGFNLLLSAALAPNKGVTLSFEAMKSDTGFSSLAVKVLDGTLFQQKAISATLKISWLV